MMTPAEAAMMARLTAAGVSVEQRPSGTFRLRKDGRIDIAIVELTALDGNDLRLLGVLPSKPRTIGFVYGKHC